MSTNSRTIDNLGIETSLRYAQDEKIRDSAFLEQAKALSLSTKISVTSPSFFSEIDAFLGLERKNLPYAQFLPPASYEETKRKFFLFSYQLAPTLGSLDQQEKDIEKIKRYNKKKKRKKEEENEEEKKEKKSLLLLFFLLKKLDKDLIAINNWRNQYHKG